MWWPNEGPYLGHTPRGANLASKVARARFSHTTLQEFTDEEQPLCSSIKLRIHDVLLQLWASESVTEVALTEGLRLETNSLIDMLAHNRMCMYLLSF